MGKTILILIFNRKFIGVYDVRIKSSPYKLTQHTVEFPWSLDPGGGGALTYNGSIGMCGP